MSTHGPIQEKYKDPMRELAEFLDTGLNPGPERTTAFALFVFPFGDVGEDSRTNYISNSSRPEMICALKEVLARLEGRHIEESVHYKEPTEKM